MIIILIGILIFTYIDMERIRRKQTNRSVLPIEAIGLVTSIIYLGIVLYATLIGRVELGEYRHIFKPLTSYRAMFRGSRKALYDNLQNVLFFIPFGMYLFFFFHPKVKWYHAFLLGAVFSGCIEFTQLVAKLGCSQTADVINNALGGLIGFLLAHLLHIGIIRRERID